MHNSFSFSFGLQKFFEITLFKAWLSSNCSATICFNLRFSSSNTLSLLASDTVNPPYLAFQLYIVVSLIPCLRARSFILIPASASFNIPIICSSLNLLPLILHLLDSYAITAKSKLQVVQFQGVMSRAILNNRVRKVFAPIFSLIGQL